MLCVWRGEEVAAAAARENKQRVQTAAGGSAAVDIVSAETQLLPSGHGRVDPGAGHPVTVTWRRTPAPIRRESMVSVRRVEGCRGMRRHGG